MELGIEIESKTGTSFGTRTKPEPNSGTKIETGIFEMKILREKKRKSPESSVNRQLPGYSELELELGMIFKNKKILNFKEPKPEIDRYMSMVST